MQPQLAHPDAIDWIRALSDGRTAVTASESVLLVWDLEAGVIVRSIQSRHYDHFFDTVVGTVWAVSDDGRHAASGGKDRVVRIYDLTTARPTGSGTVEKREFAGLSTEIIALAFHPDGGVVAALDETGVLSRFSVPGGQPAGRAVLDGFATDDPFTRSSVPVVPAMAYTADGSHLLIGGEEMGLAAYGMGGRRKASVTEDRLRVGGCAIQPGSRRAVTVDTDIDDPTATIWDVAEDGEPRQVTTVALPRKSRGWARAAFPDRDTLLWASQDGDEPDGLVGWDLTTGARLAEHRGSFFSLARLDGDEILAVDGESGFQRISWRDGGRQGAYQGMGDRASAVALSRDGRWAAVGRDSGSIDLWDLSSLARTTVLSPGPDVPGGVTRVGFGAGGDAMYAVLGKARFHVEFDRRRGSTVRVDRLGDIDTSTGSGSRSHRLWRDDAVVSPEGNRAWILVHDDGQHHLFQTDLNTGHTTSGLSSDAGRLERPMAPSPDGRWLARRLGRYVEVFDLATGASVDVLAITEEDGASVGAMAWSGDGRYLALVWGTYQGTQEMQVWDWETRQKLWSRAIDDAHDVIQMAWRDGQGEIVCYRGDGELWRRDAKSGRTQGTLGPFPERARDLALSSDGRFALMTAGAGARLVRLDDGVGVALVGDDRQWLAYASDGTFGASRGGGALAAAASGGRGVRLEQLALVRNRPDRLLTHIGLGDPAVREHYRARAVQRMGHLGVAESEVELGLGPVVKQATLSVEGRNAELHTVFAATTGELVRAFVTVNGVPVLEDEAAVLAGRSGELSVPLELTSGSNVVEISALDSLGVESLRVLRRVQVAPDAQPSLFYLGFGVSRYADAALDLAYAHKDAGDLGELFQILGQADPSVRVHAHVWTDERVTRQTIAGAADLLADARPDDLVVLFVAGHGVWSRDEAAEYYFLTHDTERGDLSNTAVPFRMFEELLGSTPARRRLLLLDTCESGDRADDDPASSRETLAAFGLESRGVRGLEVVADADEPSPLDRPYLHDRERYIYNDLRRRTGAVVFSSSRGTELSYELPEIGNGAFTEELLEVLTTPRADVDEDGWLDMDELRVAVSASTAARTQGLQHPTVDRDNPAAAIRLPLVPDARDIIERDRE